MKISMKQFAGLAVAYTALVATSAQAVDCLPTAWTGDVFQITTGNAQPIVTGTASRTWEDWIWRGPIFYCNASSGNKCTYAYGTSKTTGYSWDGGATISGPKLLWGALSLLSVNASYGQTRSYTESFTWSQTFDGGVYVQPIQVVVRRWTGGNWKGTYWSTGNSCSTQRWVGTAWRTYAGKWYWWDANARYGSWGSNPEQYRYGRYHYWR